ncbi:TAC4 isoform 4 [Pan troglodytes]|uniref:TAC4 isoform 4 n=3 Tax=Pan TaxID=9596 RepID=A0A6D2WCB6_PANTR|nr:TAC4 isoform 4 [Pan troglodytes]
MLPCLALLLLMELSVCTVAGDGGEEQTLSTEAETWVIVALEEGAGPSIQLQLQEVKMGKASQFFGLMGKRVGRRPLIQPRRKKAYQLEHTFQGLLGKRSLSTEGRQDEAQGSE